MRRWTSIFIREKGVFLGVSVVLRCRISYTNAVMMITISLLNLIRPQLNPLCVKLQSDFIWFRGSSSLFTQNKTLTT